MVVGSKAPLFRQKSIVSGRRRRRRIGNDGEGVCGFAFGVPHLAAGADHGGHGGIDDDIAGNVEVGDAAVGIDHGEGRAGRRRRAWMAASMLALFLVGGEAGRVWMVRSPKPLLKSTPSLAKRFVFGEEVLEEDADGVAEDDGIGDLHHGRFEVQGKEDAFGFGGVDLASRNSRGRFAHHGGVDDLAFEEGKIAQGWLAVGGR